MEEAIKKSTTISFLGAREGIGKNVISLNFAVEIAMRNIGVVYGNSFGYDKNVSFLSSENGSENYKKNKAIFIKPTNIQALKLLSFSKDAPEMSPEKIEELLVDLPEEVSKEGDYLIFNIKDPFSFPDRYVLLHTDIYIMVVKAEATLFSDLFQLFEKFAFLPTKPPHLYLLFNNTKDMDMAFTAYSQIIKQAQELNIKTKIFFLGIVPNDILRQAYATKMRKPLRIAFPESAFKGALSFAADKILRLNKEKNDEMLPVPYVPEND